VGEACNGPSQCCSNACIELAPGASFCQSIGGCHPIGELCTDDAQCCTHKCQTEPSGVKKCGLPPNCRPPGEICDESFGECCPGVPQGKLLCFAGSYGVLRCQDPCCSFEGTACQVDGDCCSRKCNATSKTCESGFACKAYSDTCQTDGECCSNKCSAGKCADCTCSADVKAVGDVVDAPIALSGSTAAFFDATPIRYAVGKDSGAIFFAPGDPLSDIAARFAEDDRVVVLGPGIYKGDLTIDGKGVLLFGEGWAEHSVVIEGSITVNGEEVRLRGLTITGNLAAKGNNFGVSFSVVKGETNITGNAGAFVRNVFCGATTVPSSNATLLDNYGVEPIAALPAGACE
jgi:hypothetical protein